MGTFDRDLASRTAEVLDRCTACGACAEVCPMPAQDGMSIGDSRRLTAGVLNMLRGEDAPADSRRWAAICTGSGHCIPVCEHGVNPRFMLAMARLAQAAGKPPEARRQDGFSRFGAMTTGVRVLSRLQLSPELLARFRTEDEADAELTFYTGCNLLKTPHIALLCFDILDALGVRYRVTGGPSACCGVLQFRAGDISTSGRVAGRTLQRLSAGPVLSWCPTCQIQLSEVVTNGMDMQPFLIFLAARLDQLRPLMTRRVEKRVGLHEHPGAAGVTEAARAILEAIPGLEFTDLEQPRLGWMCTSLAGVPEIKRDAHRAQLEAAEAAGVTTLAGIYHACHRELCSHERDWPFEVVNFLELVGESMGLYRPDLFKRMKLMQDVDAILADAAPMIAAHGLDLEEARNVVLSELLGEQPLPMGRA
jgi:Fe-S oxidoreductase